MWYCHWGSGRRDTTCDCIDGEMAVPTTTATAQRRLTSRTASAVSAWPGSHCCCGCGADRQQPLVRHSTATAAPQRDRGSPARDSTLGGQSRKRGTSLTGRESTPKTDRDCTDYKRNGCDYARLRSDYAPQAGPRRAPAGTPLLSERDRRRSQENGERMAPRSGEAARASQRRQQTPQRPARSSRRTGTQQRRSTK